MMSKKISYIILGIVIILVIGFIFYLQTQPKKPVTPIEKPPVTEEFVPQTPENIDKIVREAIDTQNASLCEKIKDEETQKWCKKNAIIAEASLKRDAEICNQLAEAEKLECQDNVIITQALDAKDPSLCQKLNDKTRIGQCQEYIIPK